MNKKAIVIILIGTILIISLGAFIFLNKRTHQIKNSSTNSNRSSSETPSTTGQVSYDGKTFIPKTLNLKKGSTVVITNDTSNKIIISITGKKVAPIVYVEPNSTTSYPNILEDGEYSFKDITEEINNIPKPKNAY